MFTQATENLNKINNETVENLRQASDLNQTAAQTLAEMQSNWVSQAIKLGVDQVQLLSKAQDPRAYMSDQATLVGAYLEQNAKNGQELVSVLTASGTQARDLVEQGVEQAQVNLRAVAETTTAAVKTAATKTTAKKKAA